MYLFINHLFAQKHSKIGVMSLKNVRIVYA